VTPGDGLESPAINQRFQIVKGLVAQHRQPCRLAVFRTYGDEHRGVLTGTTVSFADTTTIKAAFDYRFVDGETVRQRQLQTDVAAGSNRVFGDLQASVSDRVFLLLKNLAFRLYTSLELCTGPRARLEHIGFSSGQTHSHEQALFGGRKILQVSADCLNVRRRGTL
jgi:hypothetical protein